MSAVAINSFAGEAEEADFTPVMIYGIVADVLCVVPIVLYLVAKETTVTTTGTTTVTAASSLIKYN